jgi:hypothetical protein
MARAPERGLGLHTASAQRARHHELGRHAGDDAQELAHVAEGVPAHVEHEPRRRPDHVHHALPVPDQDLPVPDQVVAVDGPQQRALPGSRGIGQHYALPRLHGQAHPVEHRQPHAALDVQDEGLGEAPDLERGPAHGWSTEETRSWA